jgi:hypothetical protein
VGGEFSQMPEQRSNYLDPDLKPLRLGQARQGEFDLALDVKRKTVGRLCDSKWPGDPKVCIQVAEEICELLRQQSLEETWRERLHVGNIVASRGNLLATGMTGLSRRGVGDPPVARVRAGS